MRNKSVVHGLLVSLAIAAAITVATHPGASRVGPVDIYPNAQTPGAINVTVTQANIGSTICTSGYTATIRPPASYTNKLKKQQLISGYIPGADARNPGDYEEDHLISLELGGNPTDPKNLWPEKYPTARQKDQVEDFLHTELCAGMITLAQAQQSIVKDWYAIYKAGKTSSMQVSGTDD